MADPPVFVAPWPPSEPREVLAMWLALQDDLDELADCEGYLGDADRGRGPSGIASGPVFDRLWELDQILEAMTPDTVDAATAIVLAQRRDWEKSKGLMGGPTARTRLASARAWPSIWGRG